MGDEKADAQELDLGLKAGDIGVEEAPAICKVGHCSQRSQQLLLHIRYAQRVRQVALHMAAGELGSKGVPGNGNAASMKQGCVHALRPHPYMPSLRPCKPSEELTAVDHGRC